MNRVEETLKSKLVTPKPKLWEWIFP
jgi:hypothetical protein